MPSSQTNEKILFRLFQMPCCGQLLCWVNPRLPNFCPECGTNVFIKIKWSVLYKDEEAWLQYNTDKENLVAASLNKEKT